MKRVVLVILFLIFFILPSFASADVVVSGTISSDTIWSPENGIYLIEDNFSVPHGVTLTIKPGTVIKFKTIYYGGLSVYGRLVASGTSELPIYFTSLSNNNLGNTGSQQNSIPGEWQGLYFKPGSEGILDYVNISYAGYGGGGYGDYVGIENDNGTLDIKHSNIHDNFRIISNGGGGNVPIGIGIFNKNGGILSVTDSIVDNNTIGIYSESGNVTISDNIIKNNSDYGINMSSGNTTTLTNNTFLNNGKTAFLNASVKFTHSGNKSEDLNNRGFEISGEIVEDTILYSGDLPILINAGITVLSGKTLTIKPGTVIKLGNGWRGGSVEIYGSLIAEGTKDSKIYFTSIKDDSIGGDSNGDGNITSPAPKNWDALFLEAGSKVDFDNVVVRYGGYNYNGEGIFGAAATIYNLGSNLSISNSFIGHNYRIGIFQDAGATVINHSELTGQITAIYYNNGSVTISESSLHGNDIAILNHGSDSNPSLVVNAQNNWWGSFDGPYDVSTTPTGTGDMISGNVLYKPFLTESPKTTVACCSNVLFLPGFMASDLYVQGLLFENQLWPPTSLLKADVQKLMLDSNGNPVTPGIYTKSIISEAFLFNIYKSFIEKMDTMVANKDIKEWEGFPYDWRKDISKVVNENTIVKVGNNFENKKLIDEAIALAQRSPTGKITIVGHSNGGLVGKYLIKELASQGKANIVDQFIMVATPQIGTPRAVAGLLHGDQQIILYGLLLDKESARNLGYNMQSAYNLLPTQSYFGTVSDPVIIFEDSVNKVFDYSASGFPQSINIFSDMLNFVTSNNRGVVLGKSTNIPSTLRIDLVNNANTNINSLANWQIPSNVKVFEIAGWGESTTKGIGYKSKKETICSTQGGLNICQPEYVWDRKLLMTNEGDGTVVIPSATNYNTPNEYYLNLYNLNNTRSNLKHNNILEASQLLEMLSEIFTKNLNTLPDFISVQKPISTNQSLQLSVHSPVSLGVTDSEGKYTGSNSMTPTDAFTFIKEEIPNSYYLEIGEDKYIGIPKDGNYTINLQGEGIGTFTFNQEIIQDDQVIDSKSFIDVPIIPLTKAYLSINNGNLSTSLDLDVDGNGSVDIQVQANNEFDPVSYLMITKSIVKSFNLGKTKENNLFNKIDKLIKLIQKEKTQKASTKAEIYIKKFNSNLEKLNNKHKENKNGKITRRNTNYNSKS